MQVQPGEFKNSLECFRKTMVGEGIPTLWRGSVPAFIGALSENAVAFCINGNLKRILEGFFLVFYFNLNPKSTPKRHCRLVDHFSHLT